MDVRDSSVGFIYLVHSPITRTLLEYSTSRNRCYLSRKVRNILYLRCKNKNWNNISQNCMQGLFTFFSYPFGYVGETKEGTIVPTPVATLATRLV